MRWMVPSFDWSVLDREEIAYGTTHAIRVVRVGRVFFVEAGEILRDVINGQEVTKEHWKAVAVAKGPGAYQEAMEWMNKANGQINELIQRGPKT